MAAFQDHRGNLVNSGVAPQTMSGGPCASLFEEPTTSPIQPPPIDPVIEPQVQNATHDQPDDVAPAATSPSQRRVPSRSTSPTTSPTPRASSLSAAGRQFLSQPNFKIVSIHFAVILFSVRMMLHVFKFSPGPLLVPVDT